MFRRFFSIFLVTVVILTQGCRSIPDGPPDFDEPINRPQLMDEGLERVPGEIRDDFDLLGRSETPVAKTAFWVGATMSGLPLMALSSPLEKVSSAKSSTIYGPSMMVGATVGAAVATPFYLIEKPAVQVRKKLQ